MKCKMQGLDIQNVKKNYNGEFLDIMTKDFQK